MFRHKENLVFAKPLALAKALVTLILMTLNFLLHRRSSLLKFILSERVKKKLAVRASLINYTEAYCV